MGGDRHREARRVGTAGLAAATLIAALSGCGRSQADAREQVFDQPPVGVTSVSMVIDTPAEAVTVVCEPISSLYHVDIAHGDGVTPDVRLEPSTQTATITTVPSGSGGSTDVAAVEVVLNDALPWRLQINRNVHTIDLDVERVTLLGLDVRGDGDSLVARLPVPVATLPVEVSGALSRVDLNLQDAPVRLRLDGGAAELHFLRTEEGAVRAGDTRSGDGDFVTALSRYDVRLTRTTDRVVLGQG